MQPILKVVIASLVFLAVSCDTADDTFSFDPALQVFFADDTVTFDTLLSGVQSPVKRLTVYNPNEQAIQFSSIALGRAEASDYSLIINGKVTNTLMNERILGGDSLQVLVDINVDPHNQDDLYIVKDSIVFSWNGNTAHVKLVSWAQDAVPVANQIVCDETWTSERPYLISDTLLVDAACRLTIEKGTKLYFENNAIMFVQGTLIAKGDSSENVIFTNSRFDSGFDQVPGQWAGIYFLEGSTGNEISFAQLSNAQVGLRIGTPDEDAVPDLTVSNTKISNMSVAGVLGFTSDVLLQNTLVYNCGTYLVGGFLGGNYGFYHCTFSNESSLFNSDEAVVQFSDNILVGEGELLVEDLAVEMINTIVWGTNDEELLINNGGGTQPLVLLTSNIIRSQTPLENNYTSTQYNYPGFTSPFTFDYSLDTLSNAKDVGVLTSIADDITGMLRDSLPDIGAYERFEQ